MIPPDSVLVRGREWSVLVPRRGLFVAIGLGVVLALAVLVSLLAGVTTMAPERVLAALAGSGTRAETLLIQQIRLPRVVAGLLVGAALGVAGCLTQTLARNRLATPDVVGVGEGAAFAVLLTLLGTTTGIIGVWWAGPLGAIAAAVIVVLLAGGLGTRGERFLIIGIGVSTLLSSMVELAMSTQNLSHATALYTWTIGSLTGRGYPAALAIGLAALLPLAMLAGRRLALLRFSPETAASLGLNVTRARLSILAIAVVLAGLAVGVGGPIGFVALAAPIVAARIGGPHRVPVAGSALVGAALVVVADTLGRVLGGDIEIPAGVVSSVLGGPFLLWVLLHEPDR